MCNHKSYSYLFKSNFFKKKNSILHVLVSGNFGGGQNFCDTEIKNLGLIDMCARARGKN